MWAGGPVEGKGQQQKMNIWYRKKQKGGW